MRLWLLISTETMAKPVYEICSHYLEYYSGLSETLVSEVTDPMLIYTPSQQVASQQT